MTNQNYLPTPNELKNLSSQMQMLEVMQDNPAKFRSSTISPKMHRNVAKRAQLMEDWQVIQFNRQDWLNESNFKLKKKRASKSSNILGGS